MWTDKEAHKMLHKFVRQYHEETGKNPSITDCLMFFCHFHNGQGLPVVEVVDIIRGVTDDLEKDPDTSIRIEGKWS